MDCLLKKDVCEQCHPSEFRWEYFPNMTLHITLFVSQCLNSKVTYPKIFLVLFFKTVFLV